MLTAIWACIYSLDPTKMDSFLAMRLTMQGSLFPLGTVLGKVSELLEWSLKSSSSLPLALAVTPHVYAGWGLNSIKSRKKCQICVSEVAVLELFSEQGERLLARNTEAFLSK